jgi:AraC family transcriptional regulator, transcriptional activator of pobA
MNPLSRPTPSLPPALWVQPQGLTASLQPQRWTMGAAGSHARAHVVHVSVGRGRIEHAGGEVALHPSDIVWIPAGMGRQLHLQAGASGLSLGLDEAWLAQVLALQSDTAPLRRLVRQVGVFTATPAQRLGVVQAMEAMAHESREAQGGHTALLSAYLTLVLVGLWRMTPARWGPQDDAGSGPQRLVQFRQLVETQFRRHWPVARYAQVLGISPDGLHDLCMRSLQQAPLTLVHQRLAREAASLLNGTELSVQALADELGSPSASHFSHFFKRWSGRSPLHWRQWARQRPPSAPRAEALSYADWP